MLCHRYAYTHGIVPRANDVIPTSDGNGLTLLRRGTRVSLTFRKSLRGSDSECKCGHPEHCDWLADRQKMEEELDEETARALERTHVHEVYESIAEHFSDTRHTQWPRVAAFLDSLPPGAILVDAGCGNGKYLGSNRNQHQVRRSSVKVLNGT